MSYHLNQAMDPTTTDLRDEFLSEDDLMLKDLTWEELLAWWNEWLRQAQITNDQDRDSYSHGVFDSDPAPASE